MLKRNLSLFERRLICRNVTVEFIYGADGLFTGILQTSVAFEPEAIGPDGIPGNYPTSYPDVSSGSGNNPDPDWDGPTGCSELSLGNAATFDATPTGNTHMVMARLSASKFIAGYYDGGNSDRPTACILDVSGTTVTPGTPQQISTNEGPGQSMAICALSSTQAIIGYYNSGNIDVMCLDISGTTISLNTEQTLTAAILDRSFGLAAVDSSTAVIVYMDGDFYGTVLSVTGSAITLETPVPIDNSQPDYISAAICTISSTSAFVAWANSGGLLRGVVIHSITDTFTVSAGAVLDSDNTVFESVGSQFATLLDATHVLCVYQTDLTNPDSDETLRIKATVATLSGNSTIPSNDAVFISLKTYGQDEYPTVCTLDSNRALVGYSQFEYGGAIGLTINDTAISVSDRVDIGANFAGGSTFFNAISPISSTRGLIAFEDLGDNIDSKAQTVSCT